MGSEERPTREELERYARLSGLVNLTPEQLEEFREAGEYARVLLAQLPRDFDLSDEPAQVFRASDNA